MPAAGSLAWLFWCVHIWTRSGMCVETWGVINLHTLLLRADPFPAPSRFSHARELKPEREGNVKSIPNVGPQTTARWITYKWLETSLSPQRAQPAEPEGKSLTSQILWNEHSELMIKWVDESIIWAAYQLHCCAMAIKMVWSQILSLINGFQTWSQFLTQPGKWYDMRRITQPLLNMWLTTHFPD